ncbi:MAG: hypothetical protein RR630_08515 [Coprobacillus sp.]
MEKQTRISKYKDLREEMKEEVAIDRHVYDDQNEDDDEFLAFLPKKESIDVNDTLMEPLSYETLNKDNDDVKQAINEAKMNVGKEQYNTRLDILNKIKSEDSDYVPAHEYQTKDFSNGHVVQEAPQKKMSLLEKLAAMSPEEDAEELKKYEEDITVADIMKTKKKAKPVVEKKQEKQVRQVEVDDEDIEDESTLVKVLNYVIIAFIVVFIILAFFIVKQLFF